MQPKYNRETDMKIIFLDIDGVLNTNRHLRRQYREKGRGKVTAHDWCPIACRHVTLLCEQFDARIVVSSTWRFEHGLDGLRHFFEANEISSEFVIGITPVLLGERDWGSYNRGEEIERWLRESDPEISDGSGRTWSAWIRNTGLPKKRRRSKRRAFWARLGIESNLVASFCGNLLMSKKIKPCTRG